MRNTELFENLDTWLYKWFCEDARKYFEYLKILYSKNISQILKWTGEFNVVEIPRTDGSSFYFKLEVPRIMTFDEVNADKHA